MGQGQSGLLFAVLGVGAAFAVNAVSFLLSAVSEYWIKIPRPEPPPVNDESRFFFKDTVAMQVLLLLIAAFHLCLSCLPILLPIMRSIS